MNIFFLSHEPKLCAVWLDDRRVIRLAVETAQILCYAAAANGVDKEKLPYSVAGSHAKHPVSLWAGTNRATFTWAARYGASLCDEYNYRFGKKHKSMEAMLLALVHVNALPEGPLLMPPNCAAKRNEGLTFDRFEHPVEAYRHYTNWIWYHDKRAPKWTNRHPPEWYVPDGASLVRPDDGRAP